jgi:hypothetical protein
MNRDQINNEVFVKVAELILLIQAPEFRSDAKVDWALQVIYGKVQNHLDEVIARNACLGCGTPYCTSCR